MTRYLGDGGPYPVAHRGGAGLAPENSLAAFGRAYDLGLRYLETDVQVTADGRCVAFHDATLQRTLGVRGTVRETPWAALSAHRFDGERVPTVDELLARFPDARFMLDVKTPAVLGPLLRVLRRHRALDRVCLAGAPDALLAAAREQAGPQLCTALGWGSITRLTLAARTGSSLTSIAGGLVAAEFVHVPLRWGPLPVYRRRLVDMAHDLGLRVMVWTVDDPAVMRALLDDGTDGVITDRPDLLREVLVSRDSWPRPVAGRSRRAESR